MTGSARSHEHEGSSVEMFAWTLWSPPEVAPWQPSTGSVVAVVGHSEAMVVVRGRLGASAAADLEPFRTWLVENLCTDVCVDADQVVELDGSFLAALTDISAAVRCNGGQLRVRTSSPTFARMCAAAALNGNLEHMQL